MPQQWVLEKLLTESRKDNRQKSSQLPFKYLQPLDSEIQCVNGELFVMFLILTASGQTFDLRVFR